jgi:hypothetical protein
MFTNGQAAYMRETIELRLNDRDKLVSEENLIATGLMGELPCLSNVNFQSQYQSICKGDNITFKDLSNTGQSTKIIRWQIEGGIPSVSNDSVVDVIFPESGRYEVKLIVTGNNNTDSISKFIVVHDNSIGQTTPVNYNFDDGKIPWDFDLSGNVPNVGWENLEGLGANDTNGCLFVNKLGESISAIIETPFYDLSTNDKPNMSYYYSYAKRYPNQSDTFRIEYTFDCGKTWRILPSIPSTNTMSNNTGGVSQSDYFPESPSQWKKVNLTSTFQSIFKNKPSVKFRIYFKSDPNLNGSNNIFLDEINIFDASISSVIDDNADKLKVYPNPTYTGMYVDINDSERDVLLLELYTSTGHFISKLAPIQEQTNQTRFIINEKGDLNPGVYIICIKKGSSNYLQSKIVIMK